VLAVLVTLVLPAAVSVASPPGQLISPEEAEVVRLVNEERAKQRLKPLIVNYSLQESAWNHNEYMANHNCFSHQCSGERRYDQRIAATGYKAITSGENIAKGYPNPAAVMNGWMNSTGHRANILGKSYTDIGVAYNAQQRLWTQNFAAPQPGYATVTPPAAGSNPPACSLPLDFNGDRVVDEADVRDISAHLLTVAGGPGWDARYDVVADNLIDVRDIFRVVQAVGSRCG
jgi:hypothetical protein